MNCDCLIHPFQNDPGTSQQARTMDELLSGAVKIDARTLADLLDYFAQLSRHIVYYDTNMNTGDWQSFFSKSIPFTLAGIINYKVQDIEDNFTLYNTLFDKYPSAQGLQLNAFFLYYRFIDRIYNWNLLLKDSSLTIGATTGAIIRNKLQQPLKQFIRYCNTAIRFFNIRRIDFSNLLADPAWGLDATALSAVIPGFGQGGVSKREQLAELYAGLQGLFPSFLETVKLLSAGAQADLDKSFIPLKEDLQKQHQPHLALLFAFLNMFRQLQGDLNGYTRKHLDFFYKDILQFKPEDARPDQAHVVFEIQKQLDRYLLKKGLKLKDGKDNNKQEILFATDDELVVTKTTITDKRTLFVNYQDAYAHTYIEGVYMAPAAAEADGVAIDFKDDPKNYYTLGGKYSKYTDPQTQLVKPYPHARLGFILASPVLFLQAGSNRTIQIDLDCVMDETICNEILSVSDPSGTGCCSKAPAGSTPASGGPVEQFPAFFLPEAFFTAVQNAFSHTWYYFNQDLLKLAIKKGIDSGLVQKLRDNFLTGPNPNFIAGKPEDYCNCSQRIDRYEGILNEIGYALFSDTEKQALAEWIKPRTPLNLLFSGEKDWVAPVTGVFPPDPLAPSNLQFTLTNPVAGQFTIQIIATLPPDRGAVTFYNKDNLKEDFGTTQPLVKIELDDIIQLIDIPLKNVPGQDLPDAGCCEQDPGCCLIIEEPVDKHNISLYHFFRHLLLDTKTNPGKDLITVKVCGLKNFIVQNDDNVMDVNGPVFPFGSRPDVPDFTVANPNPVTGNLVGPNFYIGSKEIFFKKWKNLCVNFNWKEKPSDFNEYYKAYLYRDTYQDCSTPPVAGPISGLNECDFQVNLAILDNGSWIKESNTSAKAKQNPVTMDFNRLLFNNKSCNVVCDESKNYTYSFFVEPKDFSLQPEFNPIDQGLLKYKADTRYGFLRINLQNQDFLHKDYPFCLARQMMAMGKFPDDGIEGAVYLKAGNAVIVFKNTGPLIVLMAQTIKDMQTDAANAQTDSIAVRTTADTIRASNPPHNISNAAYTAAGGLKQAIDDSISAAGTTKTQADTVVSDLNTLQTLLSIFDPSGKLIDKLAVPIPNEPWTPVIGNMALDYTATAAAADTTLIHLYPYTGTYKQESISPQPALLPTFCDEGTLFLGLKDLVPGDNLTILFQLAEATSDSEAPKEEVFWYYLDSNVWRPLRPGFELVDDATRNLTTSGIVTLSLPANMTSDNTVMPKDLFWIKAAIPKNSRSVSETIAVFTQAALATFTNDAANDKLRLAGPLAAGSISKLNDADASIKSVTQPFDSFGGAVPEIQSQFYVRVSETLRHKGRSIQAFDYERLALQQFPKIFKVKCINHYFALDSHEYSNDYPYAPGYVTMAVIPDLNQLKAGNSFEPRVPVSLLEDLDAFIRQRTSPFVRFRSVNPRYEKIDFCIRVQLVKGKDENYYKEKLKQDIREFLAPWAIGFYDKLRFGQCVYRSDILRVMETSDYVDFVTDFRMGKEGAVPDDQTTSLCPLTPRSILVAGNIEVCIDQPGCAQWGPYQKCDQEQPITGCNNKPDKIADYCKN